MQAVFTQILSSQKEGQCQFKNILKNACEINNVPFSTFSKTSPKLIEKNLKYLKKVQLSLIIQRNQQNYKIWIENELIIFRLTLVLYSYQKDIPFERFDVQNWIDLSEMFRNKEIYILKYEAKNLQMIGCNTRRSWTADEQNILITLKNEFGEENRWNQIARLLYLKSNYMYFRLGKHCRQHWLTYLDPKIPRNLEKKRNKMTSLDKNVLKLLLKHGKKWAFICEKLNLKVSSHQLKNKYNSMLKNIQDQFDLQTINQAIEYLLADEINNAEHIAMIDQKKKNQENNANQSNHVYQQIEYSNESEHLVMKSLKSSEDQDQQDCNSVQKQRFNLLNSYGSAFKRIQAKHQLSWWDENQMLLLFSFNEWLNFQMTSYSHDLLQNQLNSLYFNKCAGQFRSPLPSTFKPYIIQKLDS